MKAFLAALLALAAARAQWLVDSQSGGGRRMAAAFDSQWDRKPQRAMPCRFQRYPPSLDYGLRIWTGYGLAIPAPALLEGDPPREVIAIARVTPVEPAGRPPTSTSASPCPSRPTAPTSARSK